MLFPHRTLEAIATGKVTVAYRRWRRPMAKAGGTLKTAIGVLVIERLEEVAEDAITSRSAADAGYASLAALLQETARRSQGALYRITFRLAGSDSKRTAGRQPVIKAEEWLEITRRLAQLDANSRQGEWTLRILDWIGRHPGGRARDLALVMGREKEWLKIQIRKLKTLGLTESLTTGYRLSPRGIAWMSGR